MTTTTTQIIPEGFKTSIAVLSEVMNLRESVIANLLKQHDIDISDWSRKNIEADQLELLSAFFNKKVKNYFTSSIDELESLSDSELRELRSFCATYSKTGGFTKSWRSIDKEKIKEDFIRKVVDETPSDDLTRYLDFIRVTPKRTVVFDVSAVDLYILHKHLEAQVLNTIAADSASFLYQYVEIPQTICDGVYTNPPIDFSFTSNHRYQARARKRPAKYIIRYTPTLRIVYVSARYHIFSDDGVTDDNSFNLAA